MHEKRKEWLAIMQTKYMCIYVTKTQRDDLLEELDALVQACVLVQADRIFQGRSDLTL